MNFFKGTAHDNALLYRREMFHLLMQQPWVVTRQHDVIGTTCRISSLPQNFTYSVVSLGENIKKR
jgi:hypothetical protein